MKKHCLTVLCFLVYIIEYKVDATLFDTGFLENGDSCTKPTILDSLAETVIKIEKNLVAPVPERDTKFYLFTRKNPVRSQRLYPDDRNSIEGSSFNPKNPVRILIHGFQNTHRNCLSVLVRNAYLKKGNFNVIVIDWSIMAARILYVNAIWWLQDVAKILNKFTALLNTEFNVPYENMYLIGHSLGAHIAGYAGRKLKTKKYNTIFGLDPAGPVFKQFKNNDTIRKGDAQYVETIHTDMGLLGLGYKGQLGNVSVYPNWGSSQAICRKGLLSFLDMTCNHGSAFLYFAQSIENPNILKAKHCNNFKNILSKRCECGASNNPCGNLSYYAGGEPATRKPEGVYYVKMN